MVTTTQREEMTWYECEECGLLFDTQEEAQQHEQGCDAQDPSYLQ
jgi:rubredoxin